MPLSVAGRAPRSTRGFGAFRLLGLLRDDLRALRPRLLLIDAIVALMPRVLFSWLRPAFYRFAGARIGHRTRIFGRLTIEGSGDIARNLRVGEDCIFTTPLYLNPSAQITIGDRVVIAHHVVIITDSHRTDDARIRGGKRFARPVSVGDGVWIGARATILPGVTLGQGCVVAAGAVVAEDVAPDTLVGGVPARPLKQLPTAT